MQYVNNCNVAKLYHPDGFPQGYITYKTIGANSASGIFFILFQLFNFTNKVKRKKDNDYI